jgi:hypothetical protein
MNQLSFSCGLFFLIAFLLLAGCSRPLTTTLPTDTLAASAAQTFWVATYGSNSSSCGAANAPCASISYAVSRVNNLGSAAPGSTIIVKSGTYYEKSSILLGVSGTPGQPITLKAENVVSSTNTPKSVTIYYDGSSINRWGEGAIKGFNVSNWIIEGFKIQGVVDTLSVKYKGQWFSRPVPRLYAGFLFQNGDNMTVRYNHTYQTGISGIIFMPHSNGCASSGYDKDRACAIQNTGNKIMGNRLELANQGWKNSSSDFIWEQEALTLWGVDGFEVAYNLVVDSTKEGIDVKLGRNGSVHHNYVSGTGRGIAALGIPENGVGIYLDGRKEKMYNISIHSNVVRFNKRMGIKVISEQPQSCPSNSIIDIRIYNNLVHNNGSAGLALGDCVGGNSSVFDIDVYHNTFVENQLPFIIKTYYASVFAAQPHHITLRNNIFANSGNGGAGAIYSAHDVRLEHNLFTWTSDPTTYYTGNSYNISSLNNILNTATKITSGDRYSSGFNPVKFVSLSGNNYALQNGSPAANTGSSYIGLAGKDFSGASRDSRPDVGAYEYR